MTEITKMKRTEASTIIDEATQSYVQGFQLAGVSLTDQELKRVKQTVRNLSKNYIESVYELYDC